MQITQREVTALNTRGFWVTYSVCMDDTTIIIDDAEKLLDSVAYPASNPGHLRLAEPCPAPEGLVGSSTAMRHIHTRMRRVAGSLATVLIRGESGTGKEVVARALHRMGPRADHPFVTLDCSSIPPNLMESMLFGHERGAFTGAGERAEGLLTAADGGTLFLDELGLMPIELQAKLLNVLETQRFRRVGGTGELSVSVRFLAATNEELEQAVSEGRFRQDLYYRLNVVPIDLPPLRGREEDILLLAGHFLKEFQERDGLPGLHLSKNATRLLMTYDWPGNVRQLRNVVEHAVVMSDGAVIRADDLVIDRRAPHPPTTNVRVEANGEVYVHLPREGVSLDLLERRVVEAALRHTGGNVLRAARLLRVTRDRLRYRISKYGIDPGAAEFV